MPIALKALLLAVAGGAVYLLVRSRQHTSFPPPIRPDVTPNADHLTAEQQNQLLRELASQL